MKAAPDTFIGLHLEYIINGHSSARRRVEITGSSISNGKLFAQLENMPGLDPNGVRYLSADDVKLMASKSALDVLASVTTDSNYVDTGDEVSVTALIERLLSRDEESSAEFEPREWDSAFWNPTFERPDKITKWFNEALEKRSDDSEYFYTTDAAKELFSKGSTKFGANVNVFELFGGGGDYSESGETNQEIKEKIEIQEVLKTIEEERLETQWTGEKFEVKPMKMYRLNLPTLKTATSIAVARIQVHKYEAVQTIPVRVSRNHTSYGSSLTPEVVQARLRKELGEMESRVNQTTDGLNNKHTQVVNRQNSLESSLRTTNGRIDATNGRVDTASGKIRTAENKLASLPGNVFNGCVCTNIINN